MSWKITIVNIIQKTNYYLFKIINLALNSFAGFI